MLLRGKKEAGLDFDVADVGDFLEYLDYFWFYLLVEHINRKGVAVFAYLARVVGAYVNIVVGEDFVDVGKYAWYVSVMNEQWVDGFFFEFYAFSGVNGVCEVSAQQEADDYSCHLKCGFALGFDCGCAQVWAEDHVV